MTKETCSTCKFYFPDGCRRYPPQVVAYVEGRAYSESPTVDPDWWCGEYQSKDLVEYLDAKAAYEIAQQSVIDAYTTKIEGKPMWRESAL